MGFNVLLRLILNMVDLTNLLLQFIQQPERVSFWILFIGAQSVRNIVLIMSNKPNSVLSLEFISLISSGFKSFDFHRKLCEPKVTF